MKEPEFRIESDLLGELQVPSEAYYGVQTQLSYRHDARWCRYIGQYECKRSNS